MSNRKSRAIAEKHLSPEAANGLALRGAIDDGDDAALYALADALEEIGNSRVPGLRIVIRCGKKPMLVKKLKPKRKKPTVGWAWCDASFSLNAIAQKYQDSSLEERQLCSLNGHVFSELDAIRRRAEARKSRWDPRGQDPISVLYKTRSDAFLALADAVARSGCSFID